MTRSRAILFLLLVSAVFLSTGRNFVFSQDEIERCGGLRATIQGTEGDDVIEGTKLSDVIVGGGGNDVIRGMGGFDVICGGAGEDTIDGGPGRDTIMGGTGNDIIQGGNAADAIFGGAGSDRINGGGGDDLIYGEEGADILKGGAGFDELYGGEGDDVLEGEGDRDRLYGEGGNDNLKGGRGKDLMDGSEGEDNLDGGRGKDTCIEGEENIRCEFITSTNRPPVADAGRDLKVQVGETLHLDGTGSADPDGDRLSYTWSITQKPDGSSATVSDTQIPDPTVTIDRSGDYVIRLYVNDGTLESEIDLVRVSTLNTVPLANAGADQAIAVPGTVKLNGSDSSDVDGDELSYRWLVLREPEGSSVILLGSDTVTPKFDADIPGLYEIQLVVNDGVKNSDPDRVIITTGNVIPVADAGSDQRVLVNDRVVLNAGGSSDANNDPITYSWSFVSIPEGSDAVLTGADTVGSSFLVDEAGSYVIQLIVNDGKANSKPDTVFITTNNTMPVADAGMDRTVGVGATVRLDGSDSFDLDEDELNYQWSLISVPTESDAVLTGGTNLVATFEVDDPGTYVAQLIVSDGQLSSVPDTVLIRRENSAPVLEEIGDQSVNVGNTLTIRLRGSDPDGDELSYLAGPIPLPVGASLNSETGEFRFSPVSEQLGSVMLTFTVTDKELHDSEDVRINVNRVDSMGRTILTGRVLDANDAAEGTTTPIVGATVSIKETLVSTVSDSQGNFRLEDIPEGFNVIQIDTTTATGEIRYASFVEAVKLKEGEFNAVERPFYLPRLDTTGGAMIMPGQAATVNNGNIGVIMQIPADTAMNEDGTMFTGEITVSEVPGGFAPAELPEELEPGLLITIQPVGVEFSTPVPVTFSNVDGLPAGSEVDIWSLDPDSGQFIIVGKGRVTADGTKIETIEGGIRASTWHAPLPPPPAPDDSDDDDTDGDDPEPCNNCACNAPFGSSVSYATGNLQENHRTVSYRSLGENRGLNFIYNSNNASPMPIIQESSKVLERGAVPNTVSMNLRVGGVDQNVEVFMDTDGFIESKDERFVQSIQFDARSYKTGIYPYRLRVRNNFNRSRVSSMRSGEVSLVNNKDSSYGSGWTIEGIQKLHFQDDASILIEEGDGWLWQFKADNSLEVVYENDFESSVGSEWSNSMTSTLADRRFLGSFSGESASNVETLTTFFLSDLPFHAGVNVQFDLFILGTWDGSNARYGPDEFILHARNTGDILHTTFCNLTSGSSLSQSYPGNFGEQQNRCRTGAVENDTLGYIEEEIFDSVYRINKTFLHTNDTLTLDFKYSVSDPIKEKIGIDNIVVSVIKNYITPSGDYSTLVRNQDGTYTRTLKNGTEINFNSLGFQTSVVDRNGNTTVYEYNGDNNLIKITDPVGLITTLSYTENSLIETITDPAGRVTRFEHDTDGNLVKITDPDGTVRRFSYNTDHRMISQTSKRGHITTYQYNSAGRVVRANLPDSSTRFISPQWLSSMPEVGRGLESEPASATRPEHVFSSFTDGNGNISIYNVNGVYGAIEEHTDTLGRNTKMKRDENNNIISLTDPRGNTIRHTYDTRGNLLSLVDESIGATTIFTYTTDGYNNIKTVTDPNGNVTTNNYDDRGNLTSVVDALGNTTTYRYNEVGNIVDVTDALDNTVVSSYDTNGNLVSLTDQLGNSDASILDSAGNITSHTDRLDRITRYEYDVMNRLTKVTDPDMAETLYSYDAEGNLISVRDARGSVTRFSYDERNRITSKTDPLGNSDMVVYDMQGNMERTTDRKGQVIAFTYDAGNRLIRKVLPGDLTTTYVYDDTDNVKSISDPDSVLSMNYDGASRMISVSTTNSPSQPSVDISYSYDLVDNVKSMSSSVGRTDYSYDANNRLTTITTPDSVTVGYSYDVLDRPVKRTYPNGVTTTYSYNGRGDLKRLVNAKDTTVISSFEYMYDAVGKRIALDQVRSGVAVNSHIDYVYDNLDRLLTATSQIPDGVNERFSYDVVGNRLRKSGQVADAVYNANNQLVEDSSFNYEYDLNGNLIRKSSKTTPTDITGYSYDAEDRLIRVEKGTSVSTFKYDGLGRRIKKNLNGTVRRYVYEDATFESDAALVYDEDNNLVSEITNNSGIDDPVISRQNNKDHYYLTDGLGSVVELTDSSLMVSTVKSYTYDSFGNILSDEGNIINHSQYTGREYDAETGLYYYRARYYDAEMGRFLREDPIEGYIEFPESLNLYPYVLNDPVNYIDPTGEAPILFPIIRGCVVAYGAYKVFRNLIEGGKKTAGANLRRDNTSRASNTGDIEGLIELDKNKREEIKKAKEILINSDLLGMPGFFPNKP